MEEIPIYRECDMTKLPKGLYIGLTHGRDNPGDSPEDWGPNGALIGPLKWVHGVYTHHMNLSFENPEDERRYITAGVIGEEPFGLEYVDDMLKSGGKYYGDWTVFYHNGEGESP